MSRRNQQENTEPMRVWDKAEQRFRIGATDEYLMGFPALKFTPDYMESEMPVEELRFLVEKTTGTKPHHRTGRKKLMEMLNEHASATEG